MADLEKKVEDYLWLFRQRPQRGRCPVEHRGLLFEKSYLSGRSSIEGGLSSTLTHDEAESTAKDELKSG